MQAEFWDKIKFFAARPR